MSHVEQAPQYMWMKIFLGFIAVFFIGMTWSMFAAGEESWPIMVGACALIGWGFVSFFTMRYEIHDDRLVAVMWPFKSKVMFTDIQEVRLSKVPFWAGMGHHIMGRHHYINSVYGTSIVIEKKNGGSMMITPRDPEDFLTMLPKSQKAVQKQET
ncbi:hypothetical protein GOV10_06295 [Candidatus Woesearchaeota archaeon]|nr:hypothetical protein [Candidatus Woesearchaeota archaeon]